jgi:surface polysaccharide O-acyltransferase-like enzyme
MISGYLLCEKQFNTKRIITIWIQVFFYSVLLMCAVVVIGEEPFSVISMIKALLPISGNQYWFARVYIGLYLLMPFINKFILSLNKKNYQAFLLICFVIFSLWRSFIPFAKTLNSEGGNSIIWFVILYCFAAYIKLYGFSKKWTVKKQMVCVATLLLFSLGSRLAITFISNLIGLGGAGSSLFTEFTSFPMLLSAWLIINLVVEAPEISGGVYQKLCCGSLVVHLVYT